MSYMTVKENHASKATVCQKSAGVKCSSAKSCNIFCTFLLSSVLGLIAPAVHAETAKERAIQNASYLTTMLLGVDQNYRATMVNKIAAGTIKRPAPEQPIWVLDSDSGLIVYYQGQPTFTGQPAANLVDDKGIRFGTKALDRAKAARNGWISLSLGNKGYAAYCQAKTPVVVCSLIVE